MSSLSRRAQGIAPSPTLAISAAAAAMKKRGIDVISFGAGEPDFDTPEHIKLAAVAAGQAGFTKYTPTSGIPELKAAIIDKFLSDNGLVYQPSQILVSNGAKQCLYNLLQVLLDPGDEVLIPVPYWVSYAEMVKLADGKCVFVPSKADFTVDSQLLDTYVTPKTKVIILNSPSNPTGAVYSEAQLKDIAEYCVKNNIYVISDEIYEKLIYDDRHYSIGALGPDINALTMTVNGVSKAYAMTGWRIGYCGGPEDIIRAASALQDHSTSSPNTMAQYAALAALNGPLDTVTAMKQKYRQRRDYMISRLQDMHHVSVQPPAGAFYAFVDISATFTSDITGSEAFCDQLLQHYRVAAVPGSAFGDDRYIRLSFATGMEAIKHGLDRLERFLAQLK